MVLITLARSVNNDNPGSVSYIFSNQLCEISGGVLLLNHSSCSQYNISIEVVVTMGGSGVEESLASHPTIPRR